MKRYLIICMSFDMTKEDLSSKDVKLSNPRVYTCDTNQFSSDLISRYRVTHHVSNETPIIAIALTDYTDANTAAVIINSIGKQFDYDILRRFERFYDIGPSVCVDMLLDNDVHIDPLTILPNWLKPITKHVSLYAIKT